MLSTRTATVCESPPPPIPLTWRDNRLPKLSSVTKLFTSSGSLAIRLCEPQKPNTKVNTVSFYTMVWTKEKEEEEEKCDCSTSKCQMMFWGATQSPVTQDHHGTVPWMWSSVVKFNPHALLINRQDMWAVCNSTAIQEFRSHLLYCRLLEQGNQRIGPWNVNVDLIRRNISERLFSFNNSTPSLMSLLNCTDYPTILKWVKT